MKLRALARSSANQDINGENVMKDFWILVLVKVHHWTGRKIRKEALRQQLRAVIRNQKQHLN